MQNYFNRIRVNYPLIPRISNPNGVFGADTAEAVRVFQQTFDMTRDGIIGRDTWNQTSYIHDAVIKLAELEHEGERASIGANPPNVVLSQGSMGGTVLNLQFILNAIAPFYQEVPRVVQDGIFDAGIENAVREFQKTFNLNPDGVVGPRTWSKLYSVYRGIEENVPAPPVKPPVNPGTPAYPGTLLKVGAAGSDVRQMQNYLNMIPTAHPGIPYLAVDGNYGEETKKAVADFQKEFGLAADGIIGPVTWNKIVQQYRLSDKNASASFQYPGAPLWVGSRGDDVRLMQEFLAKMRSKYPNLPAVTVDGAFGPNTQAAVIAFQRLFALMPDGVVGAATWSAIVNQHNVMS